MLKFVKNIQKRNVPIFASTNQFIVSLMIEIPLKLAKLFKFLN